jgi:hypothetical protein
LKALFSKQAVFTAKAYSPSILDVVQEAVMLEPAKRRFAESSMKVVFHLRALLLLGERIVEVERTQGVARFTAHDMIFEVDWEETI